MEEYKPSKIEPKWQKYWDKEKLFKAKDFAKSSKLFLLVEFPYPSGAGLHVGHCRSYTAMDVIARKRRMQGENVLYPMGWDAFGLPTENYAIKTNKQPAVVTKENTTVFKRQEKSLGLSFDWSREINTIDPKYYKWTQWIFLQMFKKGLAYKAKMPINWCLSCKIGLANEEVVEGRCERCGGQVEKREKEQWMLKITDYAERLLKDLDRVDYPARVKTLQRDWIGKSEGWEIKFQIKSSHLQVPVFTTRADTLFGCTYLVLSPEHLVLQELSYSNKKQVEQYIKQAKHKLERERLAEAKEKTGVKLEGVTAINSANNKELPIFVADYVMMNYGTGAIMAVPGHDQRDWLFAKKFKLPIIEVISGGNVVEGAYHEEGALVNSDEFNGLKSEKAKEQIAKKVKAKKKINYKLRDWVFSRQRYWGEPIPLVFCEKCGWQAVNEKDLPVELPKVKNFQPTEKGESPLAKAGDWLNAKCPKCKGKAKRETDTMPNWAGSNWYFLRYCDPTNDKKFADAKNLKYWMPIDWYNGGMEHTTLHLLYSRFVYKFLWDIGALLEELGSEPYKKRTSHGMILAEGGVKMSKSKGNVINPDEVIKECGADTLRMYEMFMGPFSQAIAWDTKGVKGVSRFLEKTWRLQDKLSKQKGKKEQSLGKLIHQTIKKVSEDIEAMKFNTAVSALMILVNAMEKQKSLSKKDFAVLLILLSPFAPHLAEELWQQQGNKKSIGFTKWPEYDKKLIKEKTITLIVQVNGRVRDKIEVQAGISEKQAQAKALESQKIQDWLRNKKAKKVIFIKDKLINIVI